MKYGIDPFLHESEQKHSRKAKHHDSESGDLFSQPAEIPREKDARVPFQESSSSSKAGADKARPSFAGNKATCYNAILTAAGRGGTTRKEIAADHFEHMQNYVTGPVAQLIEEKWVYEEPLRRPDGVIERREDGSIVSRRIDGSAVLLPVKKGRAVA